MAVWPLLAVAIFLSTPSARRATIALSCSCFDSQYFYPRPPRGGRHVLTGAFLQESVISIHALREEGDLGELLNSAGRHVISIHALREEGDYANQWPCRRNR